MLPRTSEIVRVTGGHTREVKKEYVCQSHETEETGMGPDSSDGNSANSKEQKNISRHLETLVSGNQISTIILVPLHFLYPSTWANNLINYCAVYQAWKQYPDCQTYSNHV